MNLRHVTDAAPPPAGWPFGPALFLLAGPGARACALLAGGREAGPHVGCAGSACAGSAESGKAGRAVTGCAAAGSLPSSRRLARARTLVPVEGRWRRGKGPSAAVKCIHLSESGLGWVGGSFFVNGAESD